MIQLPKLSLKKPPKLKPLTLSDVLTALINQQHTDDRTVQYKRMLGNRWSSYSQPGTSHLQDTAELQLPDFAKREYTQTQIFDFFVKRRNSDQQHSQNAQAAIYKNMEPIDTAKYEILLEKVNNRIKISMQQYGQKLQEGQNGIEDLKVSLNTACSKIQQHRGYMKLCAHRLKQNYSKIAPKLTKITNITKVLQITSVWRKCHLAYLFSLDISQPFLYSLPQILSIFLQAQQTISQLLISSNSLAGPSSGQKQQPLHKILRSLQQKRRQIILNVYNQFINAIINYKNPEDYRVKFQQYLYARNNGHFLIINEKNAKQLNRKKGKGEQINLDEDVMTPEGIKNMVQKNAKKIFDSVLVKLTPNMNVDLLNQTLFIDFYSQLVEEYVIYFKNWHHITTFHLSNIPQQALSIDHQQPAEEIPPNPFGQLFLESRKHTFLSLSNLLASSIQCSKKFISLEYKIKLQLVQKLQDYVQAGQKWMGVYQGLELPKVVRKKINAQLDSIFSLYNNLIKNVLTQQLSVTALDKINQPSTELQVKLSTQYADIDYKKIVKFFKYGTDTHSSILLQAQNWQKMQLSEPPKVRLPLSSTLLQMLSQYIQRSRCLSSIGHGEGSTSRSTYFTKIYQHIQFIIFIIFQLCIPQQIKSILKAPIKSSWQNLLNAQEQKTLLNDQLPIKALSQLIKQFIFQQKYPHLLAFIARCGNKYDGIKVAGIIDVAKVYQTANQEVIKNYIKLVVRVISQIWVILQWVLPTTKQTLASVPSVLIELTGIVMQAFTETVKKKYIDSIAPIMLKLKWQIKKFNQQVSNMYKEYKNKILDIYRNSSLLPHIHPINLPQQLSSRISYLQLQCLYRCLLELYGKIEKINDNGRQLVRLDLVQIGRVLKDMAVVDRNMISAVQYWACWFDRYLDFTSQRNYKVLLQKLDKLENSIQSTGKEQKAKSKQQQDSSQLLYELICWKYQLLWIIGDMSNKQKKQYYAGLVKIYGDLIGNLI